MILLITTRLIIKYFFNYLQNGKYSFVATYPGTYTGRPIPHIHMKVFLFTFESFRDTYQCNCVTKL